MLIMSQPMEFRELTVLNDKIKWLNKFMRSYEGGTNKLPIELYKNIYSRFFVAIENGKHMGFVRITNHSNELKGLWSLSDAYVLPEYRRQGVLKALIDYVIKNHSVRKAYLTLNLYSEHYDFYKAFGFNNYRENEGSLVYIYTDDVIKELQQFKFKRLENSSTLCDEFYITKEAANSSIYLYAA